MERGAWVASHAVVLDCWLLHVVGYCRGSAAAWASDCRYHSHPVFETRPSQKDCENQRNYQASLSTRSLLLRSALTGCALDEGAAELSLLQLYHASTGQVGMTLLEHQFSCRERGKASTAAAAFRSDLQPSCADALPGENSA